MLLPVNKVGNNMKNLISFILLFVSLNANQVFAQVQTELKVDSIALFDIADTLVYNFEVENNHDYYVSVENILVHNECIIRGRSLEVILNGEKDVLPYQLEIDNSYVEKIGNDMLNGKFDWNNMREPMIFYRTNDGKLIIVDGHHRYVAARATNTPIPWNNSKAIRIIDINETSEGLQNLPGKPKEGWKDVRWSGL